MGMSKELVILTNGNPKKSDENLRKIADFLGVPAKFIDLQSGDLSVTSDTAIACSVNTIAHSGSDPDRNRLVTDDLKNPLFIYGFAGTREEDALLEILAKGSIYSTRAIEEGSSYRVAAEQADEICGPFSGIEIKTASSANDRVFEAVAESELEDLISIGGKSIFARCENIFLLGSREISDLEEELVEADPPLTRFSQFVPAMMYLRYVFGSKCWHAPKPLACFIIDDPWLKGDYGFVKYKPLLKLMRRKRFTTSIAFIPWNFRRSRKETVNLFKQNPDCISMSIHGCDHNEWEFAVTDEELLAHKVRTAMDRMRIHERSYGVGFDPVMVFPQGAFSKEALRVLDTFPILGAVNNHVYASEQNGKAVPLHNLLDPIASHQSGLPLFGRHYPHEIAELALCLFLGRPAFSIEHHEYFRRGFDELEEFVDRIYKLEEKLEWTSLEEAIRKSIWQRQAEGFWEVRMLADESEVTNEGPGKREYRVVNERATDLQVKAVYRNGKMLDWKETEKGVTVSIVLEEGETARLTVERRVGQGGAKSGTSSPSYRQSQIESAKIAARRYLCDFRDNHLSKSDCLLKILGAAKARIYRLTQSS